MSVTNVTVSETTYNVTVSDTTDTVTVSSGADYNVTVNAFTISSGVVNTGTGAEVGKGIVGDNIEFRKLKNADGDITITQNTDDITIDLASAITADVTGTVSSIANHDTDDLSEGSSNLYYTDARNDTRTRAYLQGVHSADIYPDTSGVRNLGSTSKQYNRVYAQTFDADTIAYAGGGITSDTGSGITINAANGTQNIFIRGDIIPTDDLTYDLGSPTKQFHSAYVGPGSLYIDGQKVLGSDETGDIDITTDANQSLNISPGADLTLTVASPATLSLDSSDIHIGNATNNSAIDIKGSVEVLGTNINNGDTELTDGMLNFSGISQNGEIRAGGYLHANVANYYVGTLTQAAHITGTSIGAIGNALTITGDLTGDVTGTVSDVSNHDTDDIAEGTSNLYYTQARFNTAFGAKDTDDLSEGTTNQYHTTARARGAISASGSLSYNSSTGVISYTQPTNVSTFTNDSGYITDYTVTEGDVTAHQAALSITESQISDLQTYLTDITGENLRDLADVSGSNTYGHIMIGTGSGYMVMQGTTDLLTEGTNKFHTDARAITAIEDASALDITGDFTVVGSDNNSVEIGDSTVGAANYDISAVKVTADENRWASITLKEYEGGADKPFANGFLNPTFGAEIIGGTVASPGAVSSGKRLFMLQAIAANQSDGTLPTTSNFRIKAETTQAQTTANRGTLLEIETTADNANSTTTSMRIQDSTVTIHTDGDGTLTTGGDLIIDDDLVVNDTLRVKSTSDFDGNVNMDGNLQVDGTLDVDGNATFDGNVTLGNANTDTITSTGKLVASNGLTLTSLNTSTANYLAGLGVVDTGGIAYITDGDGGSACIGVYDGTNWKRIALGANISST